MPNPRANRTGPAIGGIAYNGGRAVEVAGEFDPDVIFADLGMPKRDGYDRHLTKPVEPDVIQQIVNEAWRD